MPFLLKKQNERSLCGKSFVFGTYKYEWSIVDNESCNRKRSQICVRNENEIPLFREFPFSGTTNKPFSQNLSGIHLLVSGTISEEAIITSYFGPVNWNLLKVSSQFEYLPTRKARARNVIFVSLDCGNLTLDHQLVWCQILVFHFPTDATLQFLSKLTTIILIIATVCSQIHRKVKTR